MNVYAYLAAAQAIAQAATPKTSAERAHEARRERLTRAMDRAPKVYPGAAGRILANEIHGYREMAWRWAQGSLAEQLVDDVLTRPIPAPTP